MEAVMDWDSVDVIVDEPGYLSGNTEHQYLERE